MENETVKFLKGNFDTLPDEVILGWAETRTSKNDDP